MLEGDLSLSGWSANGVGRKLVGNNRNSYEVWKFSRIAKLNRHTLKKAFGGF
jgi:hypothetical protein